MIDFEQLTRNMKGDVMTDSLHQMIYATDASAYREMPIAVVYPRDASDVKECIKFARKNGITLIAAVMAAPDPKTRFRDAAALLNYGFSKCTLYLDEALEPLKPQKIRRGVKQEVTLVYKNKFRYLSTDGTKPDHVKKKVILPKEHTAPVIKGEKAGEQEYYQDGKKLGSIDILYGETVKRAGYYDWLKRTVQAVLL